MKYRKFKLKSYDSNKWFWVRIYDDLEEMRKDAVKLDREKGLSVEDNHHKDTVGLCVPYERITIYPDGSEEQYTNIGTVFFVKKYLSTLVVAHEIVHATMWNYRLENGDVADFGDNCGEKEETFAHLYGQLFRECINKLYKLKYW